MRRPTYKTISRMLRYDPRTGILTWHENCGLQCKGKVAGCFWRDGTRKVRVITLGGKFYNAHILAWLLMTGQWPVKPIKFRDGDGTNCQWSNLQPTSNSELRLKGRTQRNNTSGHKGVRWCADKQKWRARIGIDGNMKHLAYTATKSAAIRARKIGEAFYLTDTT